MRDLVDINNEPTTEQQPTPQAPERKLELRSVIDVTKRLTDLLSEENNYLQAMQMKNVHKLQDEKLKLVSALEIQKKILKMDPSVKSNFSDREKEEFRKITQQFERVLVDNYTNLTRVKAVNQRLVEAIAEAVMDHTPRASGYTPDGSNAPKASLADVPLSINQNI